MGVVEITKEQLQASQRNQRREGHIQLILRITDLRLECIRVIRVIQNPLVVLSESQKNIEKTSFEQSNKRKTTWKTLSFSQGLNGMIQKFLKTLRSYGGVVNSAAAIAVADALIQRYPEYTLIKFRSVIDHGQVVYSRERTFSGDLIRLEKLR